MLLPAVLRYPGILGGYMNTVTKGDTFEDRVFELIKAELNADILGLTPFHGVPPILVPPTTRNFLILDLC